MSIKDGGQAFPRPIGNNGASDYQDREVSNEQVGMSLRDYFAAQALIANIQRFPMVKEFDPNNVAPHMPTVSPDTGAEVRRGIARLSYDYADAMLAERQRGPE